MRLKLLAIAAFLMAPLSAHAAGWQLYTFADQGFAIESLVPLTKGTGQYRGAIAGLRLTDVSLTGGEELCVRGVFGSAT